MELTGKLLIAMPNLDEGNFRRSVILVCEQDHTGSKGFIINRINEQVDLRTLLSLVRSSTLQTATTAKNEQSFSNDDSVEDSQGPVYYGGPAESARGFVLYAIEDTPDFPTTFRITDTIAYTSTQKILARISQKKSPTKFLACVGRCVWEPNQLEKEISANRWLIGDLSHHLLFDVTIDEKWSEAVKALGFRPENLSFSSGRA